LLGTPSLYTISDPEETEMPSRREFLTQIGGVGLAAVAADAGFASTIRAPSSGRPRGVVQTVRGPIDASTLGVTLPHEHLFAGSAGVLQTWPELVGGRTAFRDKVVDRLKALKDAGVDTIVDVTPADIGRDVRFMEEVSRRSGVQIVACTGHWLNPSLTMAARTADELAAFFVLEIERGIDGTGIKPGVIKVATDRDGVTPFLDRALRAAARASKATGVPVTTHTYAVGRGGEKQAEIFEAEGLSPTMVCLGHSDETDDIGYLTGLAKRGYTIGMDHMPQGLRPASSGLVPWPRRAECVKQIDASLTERIFLSNDWYFGVTIAPTGAMQTMDTLNPDGTLFLMRKVIPALKELGVTERDLRTIAVDNPRRFFGGT
jgi:phosphotriesterase-related protein